MKNEDLLEMTASEPLSIEEEYEMQKSWHIDENSTKYLITSNNKNVLLFYWIEQS